MLMLFYYFSVWAFPPCHTDCLLLITSTCLQISSKVLALGGYTIKIVLDILNICFFTFLKCSLNSILPILCIQFKNYIISETFSHIFGLCFYLCPSLSFVFGSHTPWGYSWPCSWESLLEILERRNCMGFRESHLVCLMQVKYPPCHGIALPPLFIFKFFNSLLSVELLFI